MIVLRHDIIVIVLQIDYVAVGRSLIGPEVTPHGKYPYLHGHDSGWAKHCHFEVSPPSGYKMFD